MTSDLVIQILIGESASLLPRLCIELSSIIEAKDYDWDNNYVCCTDHQQDDGQCVAEVFVHRALILDFDVDSCGVHE